MSLVNEVNSLLFAISPSADELRVSSLSQVHVHFCVGVHTRRLGCNGVGNAWIQRQSLARTALLSRQMPQMPPNPKTVTAPVIPLPSVGPAGARIAAPSDPCD